MTHVIAEADVIEAAGTYAPAVRARGVPESLRPPTSDIVVAAVLLVVGLAEVWLVAEVDRGVGSFGVVAMASVLAWRRLMPVVTCVTVAWTELLTAQLGVPIDSWIFVLLVFFLALYSLGMYATTQWSVLGLLATFVAAVLSVFANEGPGAENLGFTVVVVSAPWLAGRLVRHRTDQAVAFALRAQELEREQGERELAAVAEERARIARELHDIIAHSVSVMTIQAGAIEEVVDEDAEKARSAARSIRQTGRQALTDLRRLLGLLRDEPSNGQALTPQPGLDDLADLLDQVRGAGLDVHLTVDGPRRPLPTAVDLSAFRVVQEALTNTLKHARASTAVVAVTYTPDSVAVEVTDDGTAIGQGGGGHGLIGMRERIGLYDGRLEYGRQPSGGFRVHALLPIPGDVG